jgi:glycosyltransferase involved in cell wall biosynthesis
MEKILSIIIPTYNMEQYLERCLTSVLNHKWDEEVEVIVVNDGSTDNSLQIALRYEKEYPLILTVINKENGNYGSTINAALPIAKGKYVKILDADDWFDTNEFGYFVKRLKNIECDLIVTNYTINYISGRKRKKIYVSKDNNKIYDISAMSLSPQLLKIEMHAVTYRTDLLRQINYKQTEGISYTDQEWVFYPMFFVNEIVFFNANIYQYFIGREGQTVEFSVMMKNLSHLLLIAEKKFSYYSKFDKQRISECRKKYLLYKVNDGFIFLYKLYLFHQPNKTFNISVMREFDNHIKKIDEKLYSKIEGAKLYQFIPFPFIYYWRRYSKRIPQWIIVVLYTIKKYS